MNLVIAVILLPFFTAVLSALLPRVGTARRALVALSAWGQVGLAFTLVGLTRGGERLVLPLGGWPGQFGIVLVVDLFAAIMVSLAAVSSLAILYYGFFETDRREEHPLRLPLLQFLMVGTQLAFITGDLFNLFVAFEIMLIASYGLMTLESSGREIRHAFPYLAINLIGGLLFFCAAGLTYGLLGTLNFAGIAERAGPMIGDARFSGVAVLLLCVFGMKAGLFPLYFWLPRSYPIVPTPVAAFFSGMLTKVGVYAVLRLLTTVLPPEMGWLHTALAWVAGATMLLGVAGAIAQNTIRGILSYHILSQIGYILLAIGLFTPLSIAAAIFYITHHIIVKTSLFLIGGIAGRLEGGDDLDRMGGLWKTAPFLGILFLFQAFSLAGVPPLSGFWGKLLILIVTVQTGEYLLMAVALLASLLTLFSMLKIWNGAFWKERATPLPSLPSSTTAPNIPRMIAVVTALTLISLAIGFGAEWFYQLARQAATTALDQPGYIHDVARVLPPPPLP